MFIGPNIVTDGLTLLLDSNNPKSYPGSGNTWYDLSGNGNDGTLYNFTGAGTNTTSGYDSNTGYMMFDRHVGSSDSTSNNYVGVPNSDSLDQVLVTNGMTISFWFRMDTYACTALTKWSSSWEIYYCSNLVWRTNGTGGSDGNSGISYTVHQNKFHLITATHSGTERRFYINGELQYTNSNTVTSQNTTNAIGIGAYHGGQYAIQGALPFYSLYNRVLTPTEVLQNYNANKSRFGL